MSDTKATTAPFNSNTSLQNFGALVVVVGVANYAAVWAGYQPFAYCLGARAYHSLGISGWYSVVGVVVTVGAFASFALHGLVSSVRWLVFLALWLSLPGWLEQGFGLGVIDRCFAGTLVPLPLVPPPL